MNNDTERLLCGDCKYYSAADPVESCFGVCVLPEGAALTRTCNELGCDEWTPSNAMAKPQAETEVVKRLTAAAHAMAAAAEALELLGTPEARKHAEEMYGATKMIEQWIMGIEEEK